MNEREKELIEAIQKFFDTDEETARELFWDTVGSRETVLHRIAAMLLDCYRSQDD